MEIEITNYPEEIHLTLEGQIYNLDEVESEIDFDSFDHEFTFWGQGLSTSKKDINYVLQSKYTTLHAELEKAKELLKIIKDVERGLLFMQLPAEVREKLTTFLSDGKK